ncbi:MAG: DMT family transporter, partial [Actinobacteria bacterium]|nr:DMT family transporter [Actinomycetota bacterium]
MRLCSRAVARRDAILLLFLSAVWGSSFMFIKIGVEDVAPSVVAFGRLLIGALVLVPAVVFAGGVAPLRGRMGRLVLLGAINAALPFWLLGFAGERIESGLSAEIQASAPILTVVFARWLDPSQTLRGLRLVGIVAGFAGTALLLGGERDTELAGALAVVGTATCYAVSGLLLGRWMAGVPKTHVAFSQIAVGTLLLAPVGAAEIPGDWPGWDTVGAILALGLLSTGLGYAVYAMLVERAGASRAILVTYLVPAFALF